ncbi:hypothetical protein [Streptomyces sp. NPDC014995]|uniref:hypothetical protein n=1 Tax=Streptomyces sp. NPDC014995 TaxID=3364936 RepID=UPI0036FECE67
MRDPKATRFRARDGWGIAGGVLVAALLLVVLLSVLGVLKRIVRATAPLLVDLPGGGWAAGGVLGLLSLAGWAGGGWFSARERKRAPGTRTGRAGFAVGGGVCWTVGFGAAMYVLGALPGRNCRSGAAMCAYIPGTGGVLLAYAATVAVGGWLWYRRYRTATDTHRAQERARLKRLRKKGKGKSRSAVRARQGR